ncbi:unnamed protein product [Arctogadus glacialis]
MSENKKALENVVTFRTLKEKKWDEWVSSHALRNLRESKWNKPLLIPYCEDVVRLHNHIDTERPKYRSNLETAPNKRNWLSLAKLTLCEVIVFNRRREGEVSKMFLTDFLLRNTFASNPDLDLALTDVEKKLCKYFERVEIKGKRDKKVPVLLSPDMVSSIQMLVTYRGRCAVPPENVYLFGRPEAESHVRGSDAIRAFAHECRVKDPQTSTRLRKQMATMSQVLNLKDNEEDCLAGFMGHNIRVHRQYYRLPEGTLQVAKVAKLLMACERGELSQFKGMTLDEISIDPTEEVPEDGSLSGSEDEGVMSSLSSNSSGLRPVERTTTEEDQESESQLTRGRSRTWTKDHESASSHPRKGGSRPVKKRTPTEDQESDTSQPEERKKNDSSRKKRKMWSKEEVQAVEQELMHSIKTGKNYTQDNRTQGIMEKSQWDLKKIRLQSRRFKRMDDFVSMYKVSTNALLREYADSLKKRRKQKSLKATGTLAASSSSGTEAPESSPPVKKSAMAELFGTLFKTQMEVKVNLSNNFELFSVAIVIVAL